MSFSAINISTTVLRNEFNYEIMQCAFLNCTTQSVCKPTFNTYFSFTYNKLELYAGFEEADLSYQKFVFNG